MMKRENVTFERHTTEVDSAPEQVDHPDHYQGQSLEVIDIIEDYRLNFSLGSAIKYILRAGKKNKATAEQDLQKAIWFLKREAKRIKKNS